MAQPKMLSEEDYDVIAPSINLQLDIEEYLVSIGVADAENIACEITHMINTSAVVKQEIFDIYQSIDAPEA